jgi:nucleoside-diphosphate-sugar epimerase
MTRTALITGFIGQDGSCLAELLLAEGYRVAGMSRRSSTGTTERIAHLVDRLELVQGDLLDQASIVEAGFGELIEMMVDADIARPEASHATRPPAAVETS